MDRVILALIQARMGSTRLPGKSMLPLNGVPMLEHVIHRTSRAELVDKVCVCTTHLAEDDVIADYVAGLGVDVYRGDPTDVLARFYWAAERYPDAGTIVRITADDPFKDPTLIDYAINGYLAIHENHDAHYVELGGDTWPIGLDVEVFSRAALIDAFERATEPDDREHVTPPMRRRWPALIQDPLARGHSGLRWTVDVIEDYSFATIVYDALGNEFGYDDMLRADVESLRRYPVPGGC